MQLLRHFIKNAILESKKRSDAIILYEDSKWLVLIPKSAPAARKYSRGTKWCINAKDDTHFCQYKDDQQEIIIFIDKHAPPRHPNSRLALVLAYSGYITSDELLDASNNALTVDDLERIVGVDIVSSVVKSAFKIINPIHDWDRKKKELDYSAHYQRECERISGEILADIENAAKNFHVKPSITKETNFVKVKFESDELSKYIQQTYRLIDDRSDYQGLKVALIKIDDARETDDGVLISMEKKADDQTVIFLTW